MPPANRGSGRGRGRGKGKTVPKELFPSLENSVPPPPIPGPSTRPANRGSGRGRGRGKGKTVPKELFTPLQNTVPPPPLPGPSTRTYEEEKHVVLKALADTKKRLRDLPVDTRNVYVAKKREKQLERFLLPDAPPRKQTRKLSPKRSPCRLVDGTPLTPPARKLRPWEISKNQPNSETLENTPPHQTPHDWGTPTSTVSLDSIVEVPGYSPLHVDWSTGNLRTQQAQSTTPIATTIKGSPKSMPSSLLSSPTQQYPKSNHGILKEVNLAKPETKPAQSKIVISGLDYGTRRAEDIFENLYQQLEADSDDEDDEEDCEKPGPVDTIHCEEAILPPTVGLEVRQWLQNEDAEADRTIQNMLPIDHLTFDWSSDHNIFTGMREDFTASPGPTFTMDDDTTPLDIFRKFFDDDLVDLIVRQTNKHSNLLIDKITTENSRLLEWKNTDREEVFIFLAILILQGLAPLNVESDYWKENGYLTLKYFKDLMTYNRFSLMKRLLHFSDNQADLTGLTSSQRKLRKIWPVVDHLNKKFSSLYFPRQNIAIDESLLKWHGRLSIVQKIATKAAKAGIKSYELCESETGYLWSFFIYTGKGDKTDKDRTIDDHHDDKDTDTDEIINLTEDNHHTTSSASSLPPPPPNATAQIVHVLAKPLLGKGYTLIMDNFYNSPLLARYLKSQQTDCFGTLRINREFVPESIKNLAKSEMRVGEIAQSFSRDVSVTMWRDTNIVAMLSTYHEGEVGGKEKYGQYRYKPKIVLDYNLAMGGVDKKDQLLSAHPLERSRNLAWYKKVFRRLLNVTIHNAYVIFKTRSPNTTNRGFRQRLADEMIKAFRPPRVHCTLQVKPKSILQYPGGQSRPILQGNHFIGLGVTRHSRCVWCRQSRSKYICKQCHVTLCLQICFEEYHTKH